jgi:glycosyltransferase involved in cell wall biosynthesis
MNAIGQNLNSKLLLVTRSLEAFPSGGREMLCKLNHDALSDLYGENFRCIELSNRPLNGLRTLGRAFQGYIDGLDAESLQSILSAVQNEQISKVFVDGSNLGALVKAVKQEFPAVEVSTFFHNVEARFFLGSLRQSKTLRALAVMTVNYIAERMSVRYSEKLICLSERDSRLLKKTYGRAATHISPMALQDKLPADLDLTVHAKREKFALFVGGVFYANRAGITWFVRHVVPRINIKICIVGRGFEDLRQELECEGKVEVIGAVDSLAQWYLDAHFVIAPIFDGSGMKTKVAEALMFGKKIIGTPEAFSGYEDIVDKAGHVCLTADDFVAAINAADEMISAPFDTELRAIYQSRFSLPVSQIRMGNILGAYDTQH